MLCKMKGRRQFSLDTHDHTCLPFNYSGVHSQIFGAFMPQRLLARTMINTKLFFAHVLLLSNS